MERKTVTGPEITATLAKLQREVSRYLTAKQVRDLRVIVGAILWRARDLRLQAKYPITGTKDDKQIALYEEIIGREEELLIALQDPGGVKLTNTEPTDDDNPGENLMPEPCPNCGRYYVNDDNSVEQPRADSSPAGTGAPARLEDALHRDGCGLSRSQ
jgi:hypothetical protein